MDSGARRQFAQHWNTAAPFVAALIVLAFGIITHLSTAREEAAARLVEHTHNVIEQNEAVLARLVDAETGERGFVITGDTVYLDPYHGAATEVEGHLQALRRLTADNPRHQARLDTLAWLAQRRLARLDDRIAMRRTAGFNSTRAMFARLGGGKPIMDSARRVIAGIDADERALLASRSADEAAHQRLVFVVVIVGTVIAAALALLINLTVARLAAAEARLGGALRARASELEAANSQLEDRGAELEEQATEIEALNEELQVSNEQLEERTEAAEAANRSKAAFLANMSHDLRTPLNAIIGYVDVLSLGIHGALTEAQRESLRRIDRSSVHLRALIEDVLEFAKVEAGTVPLHIEDVAVVSVLDGVQPLVAPQAHTKGLALSFACDDGLVVRADRDKLDQILVNLLGNAIKFTDAGGRVEVVCRADGNQVLAEVRDTGDGIPTEKLTAVFDAFVQVERRIKPRERQGVGLGLAISRELARRMGGDLTVASALGDGSTFTLWLPRGTSPRGSDGF